MASYELSTQYEEGVGKYNKPFGTIFHVRSTKNETITITSLDIHTATRSGKYINCLVWTHVGKIKTKNIGSSRKKNMWNLVSNTTIKSNGIGIETSIPSNEFQSVILNPENKDEGITFYITLDKPELVVINFDSLSTKDIFSKNSDLEIYVGAGIMEPYLTSNIQRNQVWSGTIWYNVDYNEEGDENKTSLSNNDDKSLQLITTFKGKYKTYGTIFDIYAHEDISIKSLDFHTNIRNELVTVEVWTKVEEELNNNNVLLSNSISTSSDEAKFKNGYYWTRIAYMNVTGMGRYTATSIPTENFTSIILKKRSVQAFYITLHTQNLVCNLENKKMNNGDVFDKNNDLWIYLGAGINEYPFDIINSKSSTTNSKALIPKIGFNGIIRYDIINSTNEKDNEVNYCPDKLNELYPELISTGNDDNDKSIYTSYGNMFTIKIKSKRKLIIRTLSIHLNTLDYIYYSIWTKSGSFLGYENIHLAWKFVTSGIIKGRGKSVNTILPLDNFPNIMFEPNSTQSFYITIFDSPDILLYSNNDQCSNNSSRSKKNNKNDNENTQVCESNQDIEILEAAAINVPSFLSNNNTLHPQIKWNGDVYYYTVDPICNNFDYLLNFTKNNNDFILPSIFSDGGNNSSSSSLKLMSSNKFNDDDDSSNMIDQKILLINDSINSSSINNDPTQRSLKKMEFFYYSLLQFPKSYVASNPESQIVSDCKKIWKKKSSMWNKDNHNTIMDDSIEILSYPIENIVLSYWCAADRNDVQHGDNMLCSVLNNSITLSYDPTTISSTELGQNIYQNIEDILQIASSYDHYHKYHITLIGPKLFTSQFNIVLSGTSITRATMNKKPQQNYTLNDLAHVESTIMYYLNQNLGSNKIQIYNVSLLNYGIQDNSNSMTDDNNAMRYGLHNLLFNINVTGIVSDMEYSYNDMITHTLLIPHSSLVTNITSNAKFDGLKYVTSSVLAKNNDDLYIEDSTVLYEDTKQQQHAGELDHFDMRVIASLAPMLIIISLCLCLCLKKWKKKKDIETEDVMRLKDPSKSFHEYKKKRNKKARSGKKRHSVDKHKKIIDELNNSIDSLQGSRIDTERRRHSNGSKDSSNSRTSEKDCKKYSKRELSAKSIDAERRRNSCESKDSSNSRTSEKDHKKYSKRELSAKSIDAERRRNSCESKDSSNSRTSEKDYKKHSKIELSTKSIDAERRRNSCESQDSSNSRTTEKDCKKYSKRELSAKSIDAERRRNSCESKDSSDSRASEKDYKKHSRNNENPNSKRELSTKSIDDEKRRNSYESKDGNNSQTLGRRSNADDAIRSCDSKESSNSKGKSAAKGKDTEENPNDLDSRSRRLKFSEGKESNKKVPPIRTLKFSNNLDEHRELV